MSLKNQVALVTGASRGCGRGIAYELAKAGAIVYITALKPEDEDAVVKKFQSKLPTLQSVADEINALGTGQAIPIYCDHTDSKQIAQLFERIEAEQHGQLDILVNNAFSGVTTMLTRMHTKFFDLPDEVFDVCNGAGVRGHYICAKHASRMMVKRRKGLIVTISAVGGMRYCFNTAYGVGKAACDRLAADIALELKEYGVTSLSLWPAAVRTELFSEEVGLLSKEAVKQVFRYSESPKMAGKIICQLANDPKLLERTGHIVTVPALTEEFDIREDDGSRPEKSPYVLEEYTEYIDFINLVRSKAVL